MCNSHVNAKFQEINFESAVSEEGHNLKSAINWIISLLWNISQLRLWWGGKILSYDAKTNEKKNYDGTNTLCNAKHKDGNKHKPSVLL